jgi:hypothetical protein
MDCGYPKSYRTWRVLLISSSRRVLARFGRDPSRAASASVAHPVAIVNLTYLFVYWMLRCPRKMFLYASALSRHAFLPDYSPSIQRVLIAYTVDLVLVLQELFDITLQFKLMGTVSWKFPRLRGIAIQHLSTTSTRRSAPSLKSVTRIWSVCWRTWRSWRRDMVGQCRYVRYPPRRALRPAGWGRSELCLV